MTYLLKPEDFTRPVLKSPSSYHKSTEEEPSTDLQDKKRANTCRNTTIPGIKLVLLLFKISIVGWPIVLHCVSELYPLMIDDATLEVLHTDGTGSSIQDTCTSAIVGGEETVPSPSLPPPSQVHREIPAAALLEQIMLSDSKLMMNEKVLKEFQESRNNNSEMKHVASNYDKRNIDLELDDVSIATALNKTSDNGQVMIDNTSRRIVNQLDTEVSLESRNSGNSLNNLELGLNPEGSFEDPLMVIIAQLIGI